MTHNNRHSILNRTCSGNTMLLQNNREERECQECDGYGKEVDWDGLKEYLEGFMAFIKPSKERMCILWKIYRRWKSTGRIPCECGGGL